VKNVISMDEHIAKERPRSNLRDRRYAIRFPFAADAEFLNLESGAQTDGVTSDISLGGCFVCTSKPLTVGARVRVTLTRKDGKFEALAMVRIVKPRVGMGIEFLDVDRTSMNLLDRWIEQLRRKA
jgi:c-di-GMP-binding flagellar brake protein YcgR